MRLLILQLIDWVRYFAAAAHLNDCCAINATSVQLTILAEIGISEINHLLKANRDLSRVKS